MKIFSKKKFPVIIFIFSTLAIGATTFTDPPEAEITNGLIDAHLYLPDIENGYYRGSRFDWSGVISDLKYKGHTFYGQWFPKYAPTIHDAIMGPVEDFLPVGFDDTNPGESFLKIGIGMLIRPDTSRYSIVPPYKIINHGTWNIKTTSRKIEFFHTLNDTLYSYQYKKTVELVKGKPELILSHTLKNTGKKTIETIVYDHNFLMIDKQNTGPAITTTFPFNLTSEGGNNDLAMIKDNQVIFQTKLVKNGPSYYTILSGYSDNPKDYNINVEDKNTGTGVRITSDQPLAKLAFWSIVTTICPEPFIKINIKPGEEFSWKIFYNYYSQTQ